MRREMVSTRAMDEFARRLLRTWLPYSDWTFMLVIMILLLGRTILSRPRQGATPLGEYHTYHHPRASDQGDVSHDGKYQTVISTNFKIQTGQREE